MELYTPDFTLITEWEDAPRKNLTNSITAGGLYLVESTIKVDKLSPVESTDQSEDSCVQR